jgi:hypothetical protein
MSALRRYAKKNDDILGPIQRCRHLNHAMQEIVGAYKTSEQRSVSEATNKDLLERQIIHSHF